MALILNIETATTACSVCLAQSGSVIALKEQGGDYTHAENLTLFIQNVLQQAKVDFKDIDAIAVSEGPGSYTGLRIGVSTAKGLCYALEKPLIAVNTLQHFALSISENSNYKNENALYCPMIDARRMEVYNAIYNFNNEVVQPSGARIVEAQLFNDFLQNNKVYFFGNGANKCADFLIVNDNAIFIPNVELTSQTMSAISFELFNQQAFQDLAYFEPFYLKNFLINTKK